jgi:hypothetical protein
VDKKQIERSARKMLKSPTPEFTEFVVRVRTEEKDGPVSLERVVEILDELKSEQPPEQS